MIRTFSGMTSSIILVAAWGCSSTRLVEKKLPNHYLELVAIAPPPNNESPSEICVGEILAYPKVKLRFSADLSLDTMLMRSTCNPDSTQCEIHSDFASLTYQGNDACPIQTTEDLDTLEVVCTFEKDATLLLSKYFHDRHERILGSDIELSISRCTGNRKAATDTADTALE